MNAKRKLSIDVVHEQLIRRINKQSISPVDDTMAEDLIVSYSVRRTTQLPMNVRWTWCYKMDIHERGTWQLYHVRRLAFPLNISFYLMQHTPLWRSKIRILRIKKTRTKIRTSRILHTSSKLPRDIPSGSFKVWWLSRGYKCSPGQGFRGLLLSVSVSC